MERISIADDIVPVGEFKARLAKWLRSVKQTGHPIIITQNGRPAGVLLSPQEFDRLQYTKFFLDSVKRGLADAEAGRVFNTSELKQELEKRRESRSIK